LEHCSTYLTYRIRICESEEREEGRRRGVEGSGERKRAGMGRIMG
jgi:hypothetical protein